MKARQNFNWCLGDSVSEQGIILIQKSQTRSWMSLNFIITLKSGGWQPLVQPLKRLRGRSRNNRWSLKWAFAPICVSLLWLMTLSFYTVVAHQSLEKCLSLFDLGPIIQLPSIGVAWKKAPHLLEATWKGWYRWAAGLKWLMMERTTDDLMVDKVRWKRYEKTLGLIVLKHLVML